MWQFRLRAFVIAQAILALATAPPATFAQQQSVAIKADAATDFPAELVSWSPHEGNPIFTAAGPGHWDVMIRERGWILRDQGQYRLWYTGYDGTREGIKQLGYATSADGITWKRWPMNPVHREHWVEDMLVLKHGGHYYMFAEGDDRNHAVMLTSKDGIDWRWCGPLDVRHADGRTPVERPCGTPTIRIEDNRWYLFYERLDLGVWLATTTDPLSRVWTNVQDEPVLLPGPADYDKQLIALNQVFKHQGAYYALYHGSSDPAPPRAWHTNIARSTDLVHWQKYAGNPIVKNKSSGILLRDGRRFRLYTMHDRIDLLYSLRMDQSSGTKPVGIR